MNKKKIYWLLGILFLPLPFLVSYGVFISSQREQSPCFRKDALLSEKRSCKWKNDPFANKLEKYVNYLVDQLEDYQIEKIQLKATAPNLLQSPHIGQVVTSQVSLYGVNAIYKRLNLFKSNSDIHSSEYSLRLSGKTEPCFLLKNMPKFIFYDRGAKFHILSFIALPTGEILVQLKDDQNRIVDIIEQDFQLLSFGCHQRVKGCEKYSSFDDKRGHIVTFDSSVLSQANKDKPFKVENLFIQLSEAYFAISGTKLQLYLERVWFEGSEVKGVVQADPMTLKTIQSCGLMTKSDRTTHLSNVEKNEIDFLDVSLYEQMAKLPKTKPTRNDLRVAEDFLKNNWDTAAGF